MKLDVNVPTELNEITLGQYQKFIKLYQGEVTEEFMALKMLEIFCGIQLRDAYQMRYKDIDGIVEVISSTLNQKPQLVQRFKMGDIEYGFIPNLDDMSFGEYVDLDTYLPDWNEMHRAMAVLYRPIKNKFKNKYNIVDYEIVDAEIYKNMPMDAVVSSVLFFYRLGIDLSKAMMNYLEESKETRLIQYLSSEKSGVGINQYTHLLKETLDNLNISLN